MAGALIALAIKNPALAVPLAFASHFFLDVIPHFGVPPGEFVAKKFFKYLAADIILALSSLTAMILLFPHKAGIIFVCMAAAVSPDIVWAFYIKELEANDRKSLDPVTRFHWKIQTKEFLRGIFIEGLLNVIFWLVILIHYR